MYWGTLDVPLRVLRSFISNDAQLCEDAGRYGLHCPVLLMPYVVHYPGTSVCDREIIFANHPYDLFMSNCNHFADHVVKSVQHLAIKVTSAGSPQMHYELEHVGSNVWNRVLAAERMGRFTYANGVP